jgi:hypothetical protein
MVTTSPVISAAGVHHVEGLVEHHFGAPLELVVLERRVTPDAHLAAAGEHVDGAVVVARRAACRTRTAAG